MLPSIMAAFSPGGGCGGRTNASPARPASSHSSAAAAAALLDTGLTPPQNASVHSSGYGSLPTSPGDNRGSQTAAAAAAALQVKLESDTALAPTANSPFGTRPVRYAAFTDEKYAYVIAGANSEDRYQKRDNFRIVSAIKSFRMLDARGQRAADESVLHEVSKGWSVSFSRGLTPPKAAGSHERGMAIQKPISAATAVRTVKMTRIQ